MSEYIEFKVNDLMRFQMLQNIFQKIKSDKENNSFESEEIYLKFFDETAKSYFGWYSEAENKDWERRWFKTPYEQRWNDPSLKRKWIFGSMIESFKESDYQLISCEKISDETAKITFSVFSHPYGGSECIKALIESFGFEIIETSD